MADFDPSWMDHLKLGVAAFAGGMARLYIKPATSLLRSVWQLFGCITCGYYGTPVILGWWEIDAAYAGAVGASIGFIGLSIAEATLLAADKMDFKEWVAGWLARRGV